MIRTRDPRPNGRTPPAAVIAKAKPAKAKRKAPKPATIELRECPACKRPFAMSPAERQRKRRAKLAKQGRKQ